MGNKIHQHPTEKKGCVFFPRFLGRNFDSVKEGPEHCRFQHQIRQVDMVACLQKSNVAAKKIEIKKKEFIYIIKHFLGGGISRKMN